MSSGIISPSQLMRPSASEIPAIVAHHECSRVFLVLDEDAYHGSGANAELEPFLQQLSTSRFVEFELNPKIEDIERGVSQCRDFKPDVVIALGGGTAIDLGKLIGSLSMQLGSPREIVTGECSIDRPGPPLIAVPTTAGTGSEATHFAVAYVNGEKFSCAHPTLLPDYAIVDPTLTHSLPKGITAATGLDAFCQAIESIWAVGATDESILWATEAGMLARKNLVEATQAPTTEVRAAMSRASHLAGKAINISKTTAPHALSYYLTSNHDIPHGMAVAVTLSTMLAYNAEVTNSDCVDQRGADHVRKRIATICSIMQAADVESACAKIEKLISDLDCPASLADAGIVERNLVRSMVDSANMERMSNNPRSIDSATLLDLLT